MTDKELRALVIAEKTSKVEELKSNLVKSAVQVDVADNGLQALSMNHAQPYDLVFVDPHAEKLSPMNLASLSILLRYSPAHNMRVIALDQVENKYLKYFDFVLPDTEGFEPRLWLGCPGKADHN